MKVYVGNLPWSMDEAALKELFAPHGEMEEVTIIKDKFSQKSKGFGFITFKEDEAAKKAIAEMNEKEIEGRKLTVNEAKPIDPNRPRPPRRDFGNRDGNRGGGNRSGGRFGGNNQRRDRY